MARKPSPPGMRDRAAKTAAAMAAGSASGEPKKKGLIENLANAPRFFREVRAEARKITWTSRKETWITSVMVGIMVALAAVFFMIVDFILGNVMEFLLRIANGA